MAAYARSLTTILLVLLASNTLAGTYVEDFSTTTYKDFANTNVDWNKTDGELRLFPFVPSLAGSSGTPGFSHDVALAGDLAYVANHSGGGLQILDISNLANPTYLGSYATFGAALSVDVEGDLAFVTDHLVGLLVLDVSDPMNPTLVGDEIISGTPSDVTVSGDLALVAAGTSGLVIFDVSDPALPASIGTLDTPGSALDVAVDGHHAFLADFSSGLRIVDISIPTAPAAVGSLTTSAAARGVAASGDLLFVATSAGLEVVDVSDPTSPSLLGSYGPSPAVSLAFAGDRVYLGDATLGILVIDVTDPTNPALVSSFETAGAAYGVAIAGEYAFVADNSFRFEIIKVALPANPLAGTTTATAGGAIGEIAFAGDVAYLCDGGAGIRVIDTSDPLNPSTIGSFNTAGSALAIAIAGDHAFVADENNGLVVLDISDPTTPLLTTSLPLAGAMVDIAVSGDFAYLAGDTTGIHVVDISDPALPSLVSSTPLAFFLGRCLTVSGDLLFLGYSGGMAIVDVSNPAVPVGLGGYSDLFPDIVEITVRGDLAYLASPDGGLLVIDASDPTTPVLAGDYPFAPFDGIEVSGDYAFAVGPGSGMIVFDVSDPSLINSVGFTDVFHGHRVTAFGHFVMVGDLDFSEFRTYQVFQDVADPEFGTARSLEIDGQPNAIVRARITSVPQPASVAWSLTANGSSYTQALPGVWKDFTVPDADLRWRADLSWAGSTPALVTDLTVDWRTEDGSILAIADVPDDQGGKVYLTVERSGYDFAEEATTPATGYNVYRRVDGTAPLAAAGPARSVAPGSVLLTPDGDQAFAPVGAASFEMDGRTYVTAGTFPPGTWALVATAFATQSDSYLIEAPTVADSGAGGAALTEFLVTTHTTTPSVWFVSPTMSGYSVDNIAPGVPQAFVANIAGLNVDLAWDPAPEPDFQFYRVYRDTDPNFDPSPATLVQETATNSWQDTPPNPGTAYYKLSAVDHAGNESDYAEASGTTDVGDSPDRPLAFALRAPAPNPFSGATRIAFDLPRTARVSLKVFDVAGRLVRTLADGELSGGEHAARWDGTNDSGLRVPTGVYLCRMNAGAFSATQRLIVFD